MSDKNDTQLTTAPPTTTAEAAAGWNAVAPPGTRAAAVVRWLIVVAMGAFATWTMFGAMVCADSGHAAQPYYCPMHPQIVQDHPGTCPICSMDLVERPRPQVMTTTTATATTTTTTAAPQLLPGLVPVQLTFARQQLIGMKTAKVERRALGTAVRTTGVVAVDERSSSVVESRFSGFIEDLLVGAVGDRVVKDQVVARVYAPDVVVAEEELMLALRQASTAAFGVGLVDAARQRLLLLGVAAVDVDAIAQSGKVERLVAVRATVGGVVVAKRVARGARVDPGMPLFDVADLGRVVVYADVYARDRSRVTPKTPVRVHAGGDVISGVVERLMPSVDPTSRAQRARIVINNAAGKLVPGDFVDVDLAVGAVDALVIPREALVDTGEWQYVFVDRGDSTFEPRRVRTGLRVGEDIEVVEGVAAGDVVVTTGNFLVDSESRLQAALRGPESR